MLANMLPKVRHVPCQWQSQIAIVQTSSISDSESDGEPVEPPRKIRIVQRRSYLASLQLGISPRQYRVLKRARAPQNFLQMLACKFIEDGWREQHLKVIEWMAGIGQVEKHGMAAQLESRGYELLRDMHLQNFLGDAGFLNAVDWEMQMMAFSLDHWGTVCSSWVWQVRGVTKRSLYRPMGDELEPHTMWGNCMVLRNYTDMPASLKLLAQPLCYQTSEVVLKASF